MHQRLEHLLTDGLALARANPELTTAAIVGFGLGLHLIPTRLLARTAGSAAGSMAAPVLMTLGVLKAFELYRAQFLPHQDKDRVTGA